MAEMNVERFHLIGIPVFIGIYWVVFQLTSNWVMRSFAGILLFGGLSIIGRYLMRKGE